MSRLIPLLLGATLMLGGCSYRYIYSVQDTPIPTEAGRPSTIVNTLETRWYVFVPVAKDVYYECRNDGQSLDCVKICDVRNEDGEKIRCRFLAGP